MYILKAKSNTVLGFKLRITDIEYNSLSLTDKQFYESEQLEIDYPDTDRQRHGTVTEDSVFTLPIDDTPSTHSNYHSTTDNPVEFGGGSFGGGGSSGSWSNDSSSHSDSSSYSDSGSSSSDSGGGDSGGGGGD